MKCGALCRHKLACRSRGNRRRMTAENENENASAPDQGLLALVMMLRFHGVGADPEQIRHQFAAKAVGVAEMLRCEGSGSEGSGREQQMGPAGEDADADNRRIKGRPV